MRKTFQFSIFKFKFIYCLSILLFGFLLSCKKYKTVSTTVAKFKISEYEFEVIKRQKVSKKTNQVVEETIDTILVNLCEFCSDCDEFEDDTGYRR